MKPEVIHRAEEIIKHCTEVEKNEVTDIKISQEFDGLCDLTTYALTFKEKREG